MREAARAQRDLKSKDGAVTTDPSRGPSAWIRAPGPQDHQATAVPRRRLPDQGLGRQGRAADWGKSAPPGAGCPAKPPQASPGARRRPAGRGSPGGSASRLSDAQELFHDDAVAPAAVELAVAVVDADDAETGALVERHARRVFGEDPRDDLPEAAGLVRAAQGGGRHPPRARPARLPRHVHRVLGHPRVAGPAAIRPGAGPRDAPPPALPHARRGAITLL